MYWDGANQSVTLWTSKHRLIATCNSKTVTIDGVEQVMDAACVLKENKVYLPVRTLAETFGYQVSWDSQKRVVNITKPQNPK